MKLPSGYPVAPQAPRSHSRLRPEGYFAVSHPNETTLKRGVNESASVWAQKMRCSHWEKGAESRSGKS